MAQYVCIDTLKFILHDVLDSKKLCDLERFQEYDKESFDILIDSTKDYADKELYPVFKECDEQEAYYEDGKIIVHPVIGKVMKMAGEMGTIGACFDYDKGGMQMPVMLHTATAHIAQCANNNVTGYPGLTSGAANLIVTFGSQELYDKFVPKMLSGEWGGTMCLTEPQAGSSLSDISTKATPNDDGTYNIQGQKIFISGGDHEYCDNFIHLVLARIEGAPAGTKGISLFAVPKNDINGDGSLSYNNVETVADFKKMGQKGYCTTHLVFGEKGPSKGWLVGTENKGLKCMFQMMNGARIEVGSTAASVATAAYFASLQYAKERPQGRRVSNGGNKDVSREQALIIEHPDVRRMLLLQKAVVEGALALVMQASLYHDLSTAGKEEEREKYHDLLEILTPIAKTYPSEMGRVSISNGLQIFGGYGFCTDFPLEQYYRDIRIMALYEGTTGIQSLDLLGRKVIMKNGQAMYGLMNEIKETISGASNYDELKPYADKLSEALVSIEDVMSHLLKFAMSGNHERYIADATIFMEFMSNIIIAWQWLKMASVAKTTLVTANTTYDASFYEEKIHTMKFYFQYELPKILACVETLKQSESLTILDASEKIFA